MVRTMLIGTMLTALLIGCPTTGDAVSPTKNPVEAAEPESGPPRTEDTAVVAADVCERIRTNYAALEAKDTACTTSAECIVVADNCAVGLGGCYSVVNEAGKAQREALRKEFGDAGCDFSGPVCRCMAPPETATCEAGVCKAAGN